MKYRLTIEFDTTTEDLNAARHNALCLLAPQNHPIPTDHIKLLRFDTVRIDEEAMVDETKID